MKRSILGLLFAFLSFPSLILATIGVGVGTGKIQVTEKLYPGSIYTLPPFTVINTGDEPSNYSVGISYLEKQPELRPNKNWFIFSPNEFHLDPGKAQVVSVKLDLPLKMEPGNYFAFVEGFPKRSGSGTMVGIAAAAKLYFTVSPANVFSGIYYRAISLWKLYSPWPQRLLVLAAAAVLITLAKKYLNINIGLKRENKKEDKEI